MTAGEYCNREVVIIESNTTILDAAKLMRQHHVGDLVVIKKLGNQNLPIGIVTDRDLVIKVLAQGNSTEIITVDKNDSIFESMATYKGKILFIGSINNVRDEINKFMQTIKDIQRDNNLNLLWLPSCFHLAKIM